MKNPVVFFAVILSILSPTIASFTDLSIPPDLRECFVRMSRSSDSYPIFSPASRQSYCLKQYLNRRNRADWPEPSIIPNTDRFKETKITPIEPQFNEPTPFWSPPVKRWRFPTVNNFWQPKTQFWPVVQPSFDKWSSVGSSFQKVWKPKIKKPVKITTTPKPVIITSTPKPQPKQEILKTIPQIPLSWRREKSFNILPSNPPQRSRIWRVPMWSVVPNSIRVFGRKVDNQWIYPDWSLDYPWNQEYNDYNIPEYPMLNMDWIPE